MIQTAPVGHTPQGPYAAWSLTSPMVARERDDEVSVCVCVWSVRCSYRIVELEGFSPPVLQKIQDPNSGIFLYLVTVIIG